MKTYPPHANATLGFDVVCAFIRRHLLGSLGEDALAQITAASTLEEVRIRLGRVAELQRIFQMQRGVPTDDFVDVRSTLERIAPEGAYVSGTELWDLRRVCRAMRRLRTWFAGSEYPLLKQWTAQITVLQPLEEYIEAMLDPGGEVRSSASETLTRLRSALRRRKEALRARLLAVLRGAHSRGYATETLPTVRGGRMVVPIRVEAKRKVKGFIHGASATGQTVYIEPAACLELNNEVRLLQEEERREVERILRAAASRVREHSTALRINLDCLGYFDMLQAIARLASRLEAVCPKLNRSGIIDIRRGRSPALLLHLGTPDAVVPFNVTLGDEVRTLVITGPNAGGKTVAMKALGLLSIMIAYGMPVPVHPESNLCLFDQVMVEIGDNQSIEQDLSTFSARMKGLGTMVAEAGPCTLILVDEIGTGTDPAEGAALAQAALERFTEAGARTVVTTHHGTLKAFAHNAAGVENGSMEFDRKSLNPTFRFRQGLPGSSYAFLIAERLELDPAVLAQARVLLGHTQVSLESLLLSVQEQRKALASKLQALEGRLVRSRILRRPRVKVSSRTKSSKKPRSMAKKRHPGAARKEYAPAFVAVGARVVLDGGTTEGDVLAVEGTQVTVAFGSVRAKVAAKRLRPAPQMCKARPTMKETPYDSRVALDLRGFRVQDAVQAVEKLIDNAVRANISAVQILHGKGTGALREAIHTHLAESSAVEEFSSPQVNPSVTYIRLA